MWVIKLGGSLLGSDELPHWLRLVAQHGDGRVLIVPGGGVFADVVRQVQQQIAMSDACAHILAVNAMNQYGTLLIDLEPALVPAHSELEIAERSWQHRGIVWMPSRMVVADTEIPASWDVTSDSLALWLANKVAAEHLILIKSQPLSSGEHLDARIKSGLIDSAFPQFHANSTVKSWVMYKGDYHAFANGFTEASLQQAGEPLQSSKN